MTLTADAAPVTLVPSAEEDEMTDQRHDPTTDIPEADALEQRRDAVEPPRDPERTTTEPVPDGVAANPADVIEQSIDVPADDDDRDQTA